MRTMAPRTGVRRGQADDEIDAGEAEDGGAEALELGPGDGEGACSRAG